MENILDSEKIGIFLYYGLITCLIAIICWKLTKIYCCISPFDAGRKAYLDNLKITDNPHGLIFFKDRQDHKDWNFGWYHEEKTAKIKKNLHQ